MRREHPIWNERSLRSATLLRLNGPGSYDNWELPDLHRKVIRYLLVPIAWIVTLRKSKIQLLQYSAQNHAHLLPCEVLAYAVRWTEGKWNECVDIVNEWLRGLRRKG